MHYVFWLFAFSLRFSTVHAHNVCVCLIPLDTDLHCNTKCMWSEHMWIIDGWVCASLTIQTKTYSNVLSCVRQTLRSFAFLPIYRIACCATGIVVIYVSTTGGGGGVGDAAENWIHIQSRMQHISMWHQSTFIMHNLTENVVDWTCHSILSFACLFSKISNADAASHCYDCSWFCSSSCLFTII